MIYEYTAKDPFAACKAGVYPAEIVGTEVKTSKAGNPMCVCALVLPDGTQVQHFVTLTDKAAFKVQELMESMGYKCKAGERITFDTDAIIGKSCWVEVHNTRSDKGNLFPRVERCLVPARVKGLPKEGRVFGPQDLQERGLDADGVALESANRSQGPGKAVWPQQQQAPVQPSMSDDDIPF